MGATPSSSTSSLAAISWYPLQKLSIARRKLQCENPAIVLVDELQTGNAGRKPWFEMMKKGVLSGGREDVGEVCKDWGEQVDLLVDLSMDPGLLGRSWTGWSPWC